MKALLIGGTGTISTDITRLCVQKGWDITLINRGKSSDRLPANINVNQWTLDINDEAAVRAKLEGQHFDVIANFINYTVDEVERDIRLFSGKTNQYIFISTASAYQKPRSHYLVTESTPLANPHWGYSRDKIACEDRLMAKYRQNAFPITIVRPSHTYDDRKLPICIHGGKGSWSTLKRMMEGKPVLVIGDGTSLWPMTHSQDFAKAFEGLMGNIQAIGEAVHITTDEALSWNQIYQAIGRALGIEPKLAHVSSDFITACRPSYEGPLHGDKSVTVVF
ncbi:MAG: SDR family oxidoreductase, partial [Defluviitaleaceae bacterium]|nr:SDR family oxidoreductase [Defluviitaleaceae bacterium]